MGHHYKSFCSGNLPQPVTGTGRFLELVVDLSETSGWFGGGNTMKLRVSGNVDSKIRNKKLQTNFSVPWSQVETVNRN